MSSHKWKKPAGPKDQTASNAKQDDTEHYKRHIDGSVEISGHVETEIPPSLTEKHDAERREDNARDQKKFVVECITLVGIFLTALFAFWQGYESRNVAITAQRQLDYSERPWVSVEPFVAKSITFSERGADLEIGLRIKNYGHSVAQYTQALKQYIVGGSPRSILPDNIERVQNTTCKLVTREDGVANWVFPDQEISLVGPEGIKKEEFDKAELEHFIPGKAYILVVGCLAYKSALDQQWHHTRFTAAIVNANTHIVGPIPITGTPSIDLIGYYFGNSAD
jgi:hypothetical protein